MKTIPIDLGKEIKELKIEIFSDLHIGSPKCNQSLIYERIKSVKEDPNCYAVILGDLLNNSTKASVGDVYEEDLSPMEQIQTAIKMFKPISGKILCVTNGNHERRSYRTDGIDLGWLFASELGIEARYNYTACLLFLRFGELSTKFSGKKICYTIYCTHGDGGGGRLIGGKANNLQRRGQIVNSDIVLTGHTHAPLTFREAFYEINYGTNSAVLKEQVFVNASSTLGYEDYAETNGMKPNSTASPYLLLDGTKRKIRVII